jgi:serine/threonine protein kinase
VVAGANVGVMMAPELLGGRYELRGVLGRGGMAEVRDGFDTRLGRAVAIKLLHPGFSVDADNRRRFEAEARAAARLNHPNIVAVHDSGEHHGTPFIVMERLPGRTLADLIAHGPMPQPLVHTMLDDVLAALAVAHHAGILHRDIKPANILFADSGRAKVTDFGIAKTADAHYTLTGQIVGTMAYLSPDRLAGKPATISDDLYAVGVLGYEALTGRTPFSQDNLAALARAIMEGRPPPIAACRPDVDPALAAVVERAMAPEAHWRFASTQAMRASLANGRGVSEPAPMRPPTLVLTSPVPPMPPVAVPNLGHWAQPAPRGRRRILLGLAAALTAIVVAAVAFLFDSWSQSNPPTQPATTSPIAPAPVGTTTPPRSPVITTNLINPPRNEHHGDEGDGDHGDGD